MKQFRSGITFVLSNILTMLFGSLNIKGENMKKMIVSLVAATGLMMCVGVMAAEMPDLAKKSGCTSCHKIDKKVVGPAWQDVSAKYKGDAEAASKLSTKIVKGGSGVWGSIPMPAQTKLSDAEVKELVTFILGL
jgi:cytochrome c